MSGTDGPHPSRPDRLERGSGTVVRVVALDGVVMAWPRLPAWLPYLAMCFRCMGTGRMTQNCDRIGRPDYRCPFCRGSGLWPFGGVPSAVLVLR